MMPPLIRAVVVSGAPESVVKRCLQGLRAAGQTKAYALEIYFVDNSGCGAHAHLADEFPNLRYLANDAPQGFSSNHNVAFQGEADFALLLNNDAFITSDTLFLMLRTLMAHPDWAAVSARLLNADGSDQGTRFRFPSLATAALAAAVPFGRRRFLIHGERLPTGEVDRASDWVPATCLLVRRAAAEQIGLLDTLFDPGYSEDTDWCRRAREKGWRVGLCAAAGVIHLGSVTYRAGRARQYALGLRNLCLYHAKHDSLNLARRVARIWQWGFFWRAGLAALCADATRKQAYWVACQVAARLQQLLPPVARPADAHTLRQLAAALHNPGVAQ
jgi:GT2 family glycosyltransferase